MLWSAGTVLSQALAHSYPEGGIKIDDCVRSSHYGWTGEGYYEFVCLPENWLVG